MKRLLLAAASAAILVAAPLGAAESKMTFGRFGTVAVYGDPQKAEEVVIFVSGDGGWNLGVVDMARELAGMGSLVLGVDIVHYLKSVGAVEEKCSYPAADFESLAQFAERKLGRKKYRTPVLVGYSSGATLVYAIVAQAPTETFRGAVSLGFCPDLVIPHPFCKGHGIEAKPAPKGKGVLFQPAPGLEVPWAVLQGEIDQVCDPPGTVAFTKQVPSAILFRLPKVGHGFSVPRNWMPQFKDAFRAVLAKRKEMQAKSAPPPASPEVADLPLVELPVEGSSRKELAVILSGDGGWASLDKEVGGALLSQGIPVVGWNSLDYYWTARTPEGAAADLERILVHYLATWKKERAILVGYSFGADVAAFLVNRLSPETRARIAEVALLAPSRTAQFEFHVTEWLGQTEKASRSVAPEVERVTGPRVLCFRGDKEDDSVCREIEGKGSVEAVVLPGGHHFGGDYETVAAKLVERLPPRRAD